MSYKKFGVLAVCLLSTAVLVGCSSSSDNGNILPTQGREIPRHNPGSREKFGSGEQAGSGFRARLGSGEQLGSGFRGRPTSGQNTTPEKNGLMIPAQ